MYYLACLYPATGLGRCPGGDPVDYSYLPGHPFFRPSELISRRRDGNGRGEAQATTSFFDDRVVPTSGARDKSSHCFLSAPAEGKEDLAGRRLGAQPAARTRDICSAFMQAPSGPSPVW